MYASSCCSHPSLILKRDITSNWSSRVTTASLPAPLTFFLPLSSFAAHNWLRIFSFNSIPNAFQTASHWTTDRDECLSESSFPFTFSKESNFWSGILTFEEASRRSISSSRFLCSSICFPASASSSRTCLAFRLGSCSGSTSVCNGDLLHFLISRARSARQDDRSQPSEGRGGGSKTNGLEKKLKLEADNSERQTDRFPCLCSVSAYFSACDRP